MPHLTENTLAALAEQPSGVQVLARTGVHTGGSGPDWSEPRIVELCLQRHHGKITAISLAHEDFAEFDPRNDAEGPDGLNAEDHMLELLQVPADMSLSPESQKSLAESVLAERHSPRRLRP